MAGFGLWRKSRRFASRSIDYSTQTGNSGGLLSVIGRKSPCQVGRVLSAKFSPASWTPGLEFYSIEFDGEIMTRCFRPQDANKWIETRPICDIDWVGRKRTLYRSPTGGRKPCCSRSPNRAPVELDANSRVGYSYRRYYRMCDTDIYLYPHCSL